MISKVVAVFNGTDTIHLYRFSLSTIFLHFSIPRYRFLLYNYVFKVTFSLTASPNVYKKIKLYAILRELISEPKRYQHVTSFTKSSLK